MRRLYDIVRLNAAVYPGIVGYRSAHCVAPYYEAMKARQGPLRIAFNAVVYALAMAVIPARARRVARRWGKDGEWALRIARICRERFADPWDAALYGIESAAEFDLYVRRFEHVGIGRAVADRETDHDPLLIDKDAFQAFCARQGLPHPRLLARIERGRAQIMDLPDAAAVLVKPASGSGGKGVTLLELGRVAPTPEDHARILEDDPRFAEGVWLVQERLRPHPELADLALDALPTVRMTTMLDESGAPELVTAVLRVPSQRGVVVDNVHAGGLVAAVDFTTGELAEACNGNGPGNFAAHPVTGAAIAGRLLPHWAEACTLVRETHAAHFARHVQIGWDVALTGAGPVFIEANARPNVRPPQRAMHRGIGTTRHGELLRFHLERAATRARPRFLSRG